METEEELALSRELDAAKEKMIAVSQDAIQNPGLKWMYSVSQEHFISYSDRYYGSTFELETFTYHFMRRLGLVGPAKDPDTKQIAPGSYTFIMSSRENAMALLNMIMNDLTGQGGLDDDYEPLDPIEGMYILKKAAEDKHFRMFVSPTLSAIPFIISDPYDEDKAKGFITFLISGEEARDTLYAIPMPTEYTQQVMTQAITPLMRGQIEPDSEIDLAREIDRLAVDSRRVAGYTSFKGVS
ncbi:MAG: hypothetical protein H7Y17_07445 [Chlorobia bacterium]|nr:hypothetical protein [Fimbriimonadaceae bacterium]